MLHKHMCNLYVTFMRVRQTCARVLSVSLYIYVCIWYMHVFMCVYVCILKVIEVPQWVTALVPSLMKEQQSYRYVFKYRIIKGSDPLTNKCIIDWLIQFINVDNYVFCFNEKPQCMPLWSPLFWKLILVYKPSMK